MIGRAWWGVALVVLLCAAWRFSWAEGPARSAPALAVSSSVSGPAPSVARVDEDEAAIWRLRAASKEGPERVVAEARRALALYPASVHAPERASALIHALAATGRASDARGEAEDMVNRYPDSEWVREIERFTGAHRRRTLRARADGSVESR